jgi:hypothetical protein
MVMVTLGFVELGRKSPGIILYISYTSFLKPDMAWLRLLQSRIRGCTIRSH